MMITVFIHSRGTEYVIGTGEVTVCIFVILLQSYW